MIPSWSGGSGRSSGHHPPYLPYLPYLPTALKNVQADRQPDGAPQLEQALRFAALREQVFAVGDVVDGKFDVEAIESLAKHEVERAAALFDDVRRLIRSDIRDAIAEVIEQ